MEMVVFKVWRTANFRLNSGSTKHLISISCINHEEKVRHLANTVLILGLLDNARMTTEEITQPLPLKRTDRSLPIALLRARETVMIPVRKMLQESRISEEKWRVLRVVEESGPIEQTRIADKACLHPSSLTRIMHALDRDGLLERSTDSSDRYQSTALITDAGRALIHEHTARCNHLFARLENQFGTDKLDTLLDLLDELQQVRL